MSGSNPEIVALKFLLQHSEPAEIVSPQELRYANGLVARFKQAPMEERPGVDLTLRHGYILLYRRSVEPTAAAAIALVFSRLSAEQLATVEAEPDALHLDNVPAPVLSSARKRRAKSKPTS